MFQEQTPLYTKAPITIDKPDGTDPPFTLRGFNAGDTVIQMLGRGGEDAGSFVFDDGLTFNTPKSEDQPVVASTSNVFAGEIVSGSGDTYTVNVYENGLSSGAVTRSVRQLQIDSGDTIPAGTWAMIGKGKDGSYFMQVPVWL